MSDLTLTKAEKGGSFEVQKDDVIVVRLPENPTTGYRWAFEEVDGKILEREGSDFALRSDAGIGGGGERSLTLRAKRAGMAHVELKLTRPWEQREEIDRYNFTVQVG